MTVQSAMTTPRLSRVAALTLAILAATALSPVAQSGEFPAVIELSSLDGSNGFQISGERLQDRSGRSVASAGDVNGDGLSDVIVGAYGADPHGSMSGNSYVVFGKTSSSVAAFDLSALNGTNGFRIAGEAADDQSGRTVASAGDINGDRLVDLIVGAWHADPNGYNSGASYVVFGKTTAFAPAVELSVLDGGDGFQINGEDVDHWNGFAVASAGDVNGDGFADFIAGAPGAGEYCYYPYGCYRLGASYVVFGKAAGFDATLELSSLNGSDGFQINSLTGVDSGTAVASAGDINGDGFDDLVLGLPGAGSAYPYGVRTYEEGAGVVVFGRASGFPATLEYSSLDGTNGFFIEGEAHSDVLGAAVAGVGDINGDGFDDVIFGAPGADPNGSRSGTSYVVFGRASGFAGILDATSLDGSNGFRINGEASDDHSGEAVRAAGDVNGDGFDDLFVGSHAADPNGSQSGSSYVVFGKASTFAATLELSSLSGSNGFQINGKTALDNSGKSVAAAGDFNGDGFGDLIVGAYGADPHGVYSGASYVVFGRAPDAAVTRVGSAAGQYMSGGAFADSLQGRDGNDVLEGRGDRDLLDGWRGVDVASYRHAAGPVRADLVTPAGNLGEALGDSYRSIEGLDGSAFDDLLFGNALGNAISGNGGSDRLLGRLGNDTLTGGAGMDLSYGGPGADVFALRKASDSPASAGRDRIQDFDAGDAVTTVDRIDVEAIDAQTGAPGNQAFTYIGAALFSHTQGELRIQQSGANAVVSGDVDGNGLADFQILLQGFSNIAGLTAADFKL